MKHDQDIHDISEQENPIMMLVLMGCLAFMCIFFFDALLG